MTTRTGNNLFCYLAVACVWVACQTPTQAERVSEASEAVRLYFAGISFSEQRVITTDADYATSVYAADLDGDGDADVLSASYGDGEIAWYENLGDGAFSEPRVISSDNQAGSVRAADLDGDGDHDVLYETGRNGHVVWLENQGQRQFSSRRVISTGADFAHSLHSSDLDGDGDIDVLSGSDGKIAWYENRDADFVEREVWRDRHRRALSVDAVDLDGDGDSDILSAWDDRIAWYENLGNGTFSAQQVILREGAAGERSVHAADLDGDSDADVLYTLRVIRSSPPSIHGDTIAWFENLGSGRFSEQRMVTSEADGAHSVVAADLDGDGDVDVVSASIMDSDALGEYGEDKIAWYENLGNGVFSAQRGISTTADAPLSVHVADLDGDGDGDVLSASADDDKIAWYENIPANDDMAEALEIAGAPGRVVGNSAGATKETGEAAHGGNRGGASVWFRWRAPATGDVAFDTIGSGFDTLLAVYEDAGLIAENDDAASGNTSAVAFLATEGNTYLIAVDGYGGQAGSYVLNWRLETGTPPQATPGTLAEALDMLADAQAALDTLGTLTEGLIAIVEVALAERNEALEALDDALAQADAYQMQLLETETALETCHRQSQEQIAGLQAAEAELLACQAAQ